MSHSLQTTNLPTGLHTAEFLFPFQLFAQKCFLMWVFFFLNSWLGISFGTEKATSTLPKRATLSSFRSKSLFWAYCEQMQQPVTTVKLDGQQVSPSEQQQWLINNNGWKTKFKCYVWLQRQQYSHAVVDVHPARQDFQQLFLTTVLLYVCGKTF